MTPAEKEQLWNCIMKMRSMPWKGPRGGTYNWTQREMRNLYQKLVVYGDNNQFTAAWRLLNEGKYKYMIYPWYKAQLINCVTFGPPPNCVYVADATPTFGAFDDVYIIDTDTSTTIASSVVGDWTFLFMDLQNIPFKVWGNCGDNLDTLKIYIEASTPPENWVARFFKTANPSEDIPITWSLVSCSFDTTEFYQNYLYYPFCGPFGATTPDYTLDTLGGFFEPIKGRFNPPINLTDINGLERGLRAVFGSQIDIGLFPDSSATPATFTIVACGIYNVGYTPSVPIGSSFTYTPTGQSCSGLNNLTPPTCGKCYWTGYGSVPWPVSGYTINGLDADDPTTYQLLGGSYGGYGFSAVDALNSLRHFYFNIEGPYLNLPVIDVGPGVYYIEPPTGWNAANSTCEPGCMGVIIPSTDQYLASLYEGPSSLKIDFYSNPPYGPIDLADTANAQGQLKSIYENLYGLDIVVSVSILPSGDFEILVFNTWYPPPFSSPYVESALLPGTYYYFTQIACP